MPIYIREPYDDITVRISGERIRFDREPILYNDRTMVPMRKIFEELGADVSWNDSEQTATGKKDDRTVKVTVNSKTMYVNNKKITLDTAPIVVSARTLVPVRAVAEGLGCDVDWTERTSTVDIEPKEFKWSAWTDELPNDVDDDLYYIEKRDEYRYRTCRREYKTSEDGVYLGHWPIKEEKIYGEWSDWQRESVSESSSREVETKTEYEPKRYKFAHYCTGAIDDVNNRYMTADYKFHDQCIRHDIGWFDYMLPAAPDGQGGYVTYNSDGELNRCSNGCYRYYVMDESGGEYTMYRYRKIGWLYYYQWWGDWTDCRIGTPMTRMILMLMMIRESMLNGAPLCDIKKRDKILKKFMMVKIAACRHIHFRLCRRADGRREINMKKTNKIIGGIVVTSLAASIIGGCYKFEAEKNVVPCLYASPS